MFYLRLSFLTIGGLLALFIGFKVATWKAEAEAASVLREKVTKLEKTIQQQRDGVIAANRKRLEVSLELSAKEKQLADALALKQKVIVRYVSKDPLCDLNSDVVRVLNDARAGDFTPLPPATDRATGSARTPGPQPDPHGTPPREGSSLNLP